LSEGWSRLPHQRKQADQHCQHGMGQVA
jgi:hypothetical protein